MNRYYLEVRYQVTPVDAVDEHTDAMMDTLSVEPNLIDPDVGADLRRGWVDVCTTVEGEDEASALRTGLVAVRSAAHHAGAATPGWEADLDKVRATVRSRLLSSRYGWQRNAPHSCALPGARSRACRGGASWWTLRIPAGCRRPSVRTCSRRWSAK
jgi:hypothetical protein